MLRTPGRCPTSATAAGSPGPAWGPPCSTWPFCGCGAAPGAGRWRRAWPCSLRHGSRAWHCCRPRPRPARQTCPPGAAWRWTRAASRRRTCAGNPWSSTCGPAGARRAGAKCRCCCRPARRTGRCASCGSTRGNRPKPWRALPPGRACPPPMCCWTRAAGPGAGVQGPAHHAVLRRPGPAGRRARRRAVGRHAGPPPGADHRPGTPRPMTGAYLLPPPRRSSRPPRLPSTSIALPLADSTAVRK